MTNTQGHTESCKSDVFASLLENLETAGVATVDARGYERFIMGDAIPEWEVNDSEVLVIEWLTDGTATCNCRRG